MLKSGEHIVACYNNYIVMLIFTLPKSRKNFIIKTAQEYLSVFSIVPKSINGIFLKRLLSHTRSPKQPKISKQATLLCQGFLLRKATSDRAADKHEQLVHAQEKYRHELGFLEMNSFREK